MPYFLNVHEVLQSYDEMISSRLKFPLESILFHCNGNAAKGCFVLCFVRACTMTVEIRQGVSYSGERLEEFCHVLTYLNTGMNTPA